MTTMREGERQRRRRLSSEFWLIAATSTQLWQQRTKTSKKIPIWLHKKVKGDTTGKKLVFKKWRAFLHGKN